MSDRTATTIRILERMLAGEGRNPLPFSERYAVRNALETLRELDATAAPVVVGEDVATSFYAACQRAAAELPYDWEIRICLENGAGTVELVDPDGEVTNMDVDADDRMTAEVNAAIDEALTAALAGEGK